MSHYVYAPKVDANHTQIVKWYEECFCSVVELHKVGFGCPDLMIGAAGLTELAEVKTADGQIEPSQRTFMTNWRGSKVNIVRNQQDVMEHVQRMRTKQAR